MYGSRYDSDIMGMNILCYFNFPKFLIHDNNIDIEYIYQHYKKMEFEKHEIDKGISWCVHKKLLKLSKYQLSLTKKGKEYYEKGEPALYTPHLPDWSFKKMELVRKFLNNNKGRKYGK